MGSGKADDKFAGWLPSIALLFYMQFLGSPEKVLIDPVGNQGNRGLAYPLSNGVHYTLSLARDQMSVLIQKLFHT